MQWNSNADGHSYRQQGMRKHDRLDQTDEEYRPAVEVLSQISNLERCLPNIFPKESSDYMKGRKTITRKKIQYIAAHRWYTFSESGIHNSRQRLALPEDVLAKSELRELRMINMFWTYSLSLSLLPQPT